MKQGSVADVDPHGWVAVRVGSVMVDDACSPTHRWPPCCGKGRPAGTGARGLNTAAPTPPARHQRARSATEPEGQGQAGGARIEGSSPTPAGYRPAAARRSEGGRERVRAAAIASGLQ